MEGVGVMVGAAVAAVVGVVVGNFLAAAVGIWVKVGGEAAVLAIVGSNAAVVIGDVAGGLFVVVVQAVARYRHTQRMRQDKGRGSI